MDKKQTKTILPLSCLPPTCPPKSNLLVACFLESFKHRVLVASLQKDYDCMRMQTAVNWLFKTLLQADIPFPGQHVTKFQPAILCYR